MKKRVCTKCHIEKPITHFLFLTAKKRRETHCKPCRKLYRKNWYQAKKKPKPVKYDLMATVYHKDGRKCFVAQLLTEYPIGHKNRGDILQMLRKKDRRCRGWGYKEYTPPIKLQKKPKKKPKVLPEYGFVNEQTGEIAYPITSIPEAAKRLGLARQAAYDIASGHCMRSKNWRRGTLKDLVKAKILYPPINI